MASSGSNSSDNENIKKFLNLFGKDEIKIGKIKDHDYGLCIKYHNNGKIKVIKEYTDGKLSYIRIFDKKGNLIEDMMRTYYYGHSKSKHNKHLINKSNSSASK